jgi:hypothetical protein
MEYPKDLTKLINYMRKTYGPFLSKILELYPENTSQQCNLAQRYKSILDYFPVIKKSDEDRLGEFITMTAIEECDRRLQFLAVVINYYLFSHLERSHAFSDDDDNDDSVSGLHEEELDDEDDDNPNDDNYHDSQDSSRSDDNSSDDNTKSFAFHPKKITSFKSREKYEKYNDAWKFLILGQDKAVLFLYPIMSKTSKSVFETKVLTDQVLGAFKNILKENVQFLLNGKTPIPKNIITDNKLVLVEDGDDSAHVDKKQKK